MLYRNMYMILAVMTTSTVIGISIVAQPYPSIPQRLIIAGVSILTVVFLVANRERRRRLDER